MEFIPKIVPKPQLGLPYLHMLIIVHGIADGLQWDINNGLILTWIHNQNIPGDSANKITWHYISLPISFNNINYTCISTMCGGGTNWARTQYFSGGFTNSSVRIGSYCHDVSYATYPINLMCIGV